MGRQTVFMGGPQVSHIRFRRREIPLA